MYLSYYLWYMFVVAFNFMVTSKTDINLFKENIIIIQQQHTHTHLPEHIYEWMYVCTTWACERECVESGRIVP